MTTLTPHQLDILTRTVLGEAAPNDPAGQAAVAAVILNRAASGQFPSDPAAVALQKAQFSAWNPIGEGGNNLVRTSSKSSAYQTVSEIVQGVADGEIPDPTGGATYYYDPSGMAGGRAPGWAASMYPTASVGGQLFFSPHPVPPADVPAVASAYADTSVTPAQAAATNSGLPGSSDASSIYSNILPSLSGASNPNIINTSFGAANPVPLAPLTPSNAQAGSSAADSLALNPTVLPFGADINGAYSAWAGLPTYTGPQMTTDLGNTYDSSSGGATLPAASSVDDGSGTGTPSPSVPLPRPRPDYAAPAAPPDAPPTVTINGNTYQVGSILQSAGRSYQVQADGTFKAMPHMSIGGNTVAGGIAAPLLTNALQTAEGAVPSLAGQASSAVGSIFGKLFGNTVPSIPSPSANSQALTVPSAWASPYLNSPAAQSTAPAGGGYNELDAQAGPSAWAAPYYNTAASSSGASNSGSSSMAMNDPGYGNPNAGAGADLSSLSISPSVSVPQYIDVQKQETVPGQPIETGSGVTWVSDSTDPNGGEYVLSSPQYSAPTTKLVTVKELNPNYVPPANPYTTPPLAYSPVNGLTTDNPFADWFGSTPLGHLTSALTGGTQSNTLQHGGLLSIFSGGSPFGIGSNLSTPAQIQSIYAAMTPQQVANQNPAALSALASGQSSYSIPGGNGALLPTATVSGGSRNTYADSSIGGDLSQSSF